MDVFIFVIFWLSTGALGSYFAESSINNYLNKKYPTTVRPFHFNGLCIFMSFFGFFNLIAAILFVVVVKSLLREDI